MAWRLEIDSEGVETSGQKTSGQLSCCLSLPPEHRTGLEPWYTDLALGLACPHTPAWPPPALRADSTPAASASGLGGSAARGSCPGPEGFPPSSCSPPPPIGSCPGKGCPGVGECPSPPSLPQTFISPIRSPQSPAWDIPPSARTGREWHSPQRAGQLQCSSPLC